MPLQVLRAGLLAAIMCVAAAQASAADLYGETYDPREDQYVDEEPYPPAPYVYRPRDLYDDPPIRYTDRHAPYAQGHDHSYRHGYDQRAGACLPRWQVRKLLRSEGWVDIQPLDRDRRIVTLRARREETGRMFLLRVDRCSGEVVRARPDYLRSFGEGSPSYPHRRAYSAY